MSDSQQYDQVTVSADGVTVAKRFEEDEFPVPAIAFEIRSTRPETVTVAVTDAVPEGVSVEDLGFHPEYGSEYWTIDEDEISFEREIEAESEYTTVYGIRATGTDDIEQFLTEPRVESVDPPLADDGAPVVDGSGSDIVRDVISGDGDVPGLDEGGESVEGDRDGRESPDDEDVETLDLADPSDRGDVRSGPEAAAADESGDEPVADTDAESLVGALAAEIRNGNVDADDVKLLREAFDLATDTGSVDARIKHLQTEISDLVAYTDALEEFLDENGTGDELIEEFREDVESFESDLDEVREMAAAHEESLSAIEETVDEVESSMNSFESNMDEVLGEVDEARSGVEAVEGTVEDLESRIGDVDVADLQSDIEEVNEEIQDLKEWRDQLTSVIGGS